MSDGNRRFLNDELSKRTSIFGLRLWVVLGICVSSAIVLVLFLISIWFTSKRNNKKNSSKHKSSQRPIIPNISKEIQEIRIDTSRSHTHSSHENPKLHQAPIPEPLPESNPLARSEGHALLGEDENPTGNQRIHIEIGKGHRISYPERVGGGGSSHGSGETKSGDQIAIAVPEVSHLGSQASMLQSMKASMLDGGGFDGLLWWWV